MTAPAPRDTRDGRDIGWRQVLLIAAAIVLIVLGLDVVSGFVGPLDALLGYAPLVILILVVATFWIMYFGLRPRRPR